MLENTWIETRTPKYAQSWSPFGKCQYREPRKVVNNDKRCSRWVHGQEAVCRLRPVYSPPYLQAFWGDFNEVGAYFEGGGVTNCFGLLRGLGLYYSLSSRDSKDWIGLGWSSRYQGHKPARQSLDPNCCWNKCFIRYVWFCIWVLFIIFIFHLYLNENQQESYTKTFIALHIGETWSREYSKRCNDTQ